MPRLSAAAPAFSPSSTALNIGNNGSASSAINPPAAVTSASAEPAASTKSSRRAAGKPESARPRKAESTSAASDAKKPKNPPKENRRKPHRPAADAKPPPGYPADGGLGEGDDDAPPKSASAPPNQRSKTSTRGEPNPRAGPDPNRRRGAAAAASENTKKWWHRIKGIDPITLFALRDLAYAPFLLNEAEVAAAARDPQGAAIVKHYFDPIALAEYFCKTGNFTNPINRTPLTRSDCMRLDAHIRTEVPRRFHHDDYKTNVMEVFDAQSQANVDVSSSHTEPMRREAGLVLANLFNFSTASRQLPSAPPPSSSAPPTLMGRHPRGAAGGAARPRAAEGLIDDDVAPFDSAAATSSLEFPALAPVSAQSWACFGCAALNPRADGASFCFKCGAPKPKSADFWTCGACAHPENDRESMRCEKCGELPPNDSEAGSSFANLRGSKKANAAAPSARPTLWGTTVPSPPPDLANFPSLDSGTSRFPPPPQAVPATRPQLNLLPRSILTPVEAAPVPRSSVFGTGKARNEPTALQDLRPSGAFSSLGSVATLAEKNLLCPYPPNALRTCRELGLTWFHAIEEQISSFLSSSGASKNSLSLSAMREPRRRFLRQHFVTYYGLSVVEQDPEPHTHLVVASTPFSFVPEPTLHAACIMFHDIAQCDSTEEKRSLLPRFASSTPGIALWFCTFSGFRAHSPVEAIRDAVATMAPIVRDGDYDVLCADREKGAYFLAFNSSTEKAKRCFKKIQMSVNSTGGSSELISSSGVKFKKAQFWPVGGADWMTFQIRRQAEAEAELAAQLTPEEAETRRIQSMLEAEREIKLERARKDKMFLSGELKTAWDDDDDVVAPAKPPSVAAAPVDAVDDDGFQLVSSTSTKTTAKDKSSRASTKNAFAALDD